VAQCERNAERAALAQRARAMRSHALPGGGQRPIDAACVLVHLAPCVGCPGVVALARRRGQREPDRVIDPRGGVEAGKSSSYRLSAPGGEPQREPAEPNRRLARRWKDR